MTGAPGLRFRFGSVTAWIGDAFCWGHLRWG